MTPGWILPAGHGRRVFTRRKWLLLFVAFAISSCASGGAGAPSKNYKGATIGPATVAPGTSEFESPWPFGPLGMDED